MFDCRGYFQQENNEKIKSYEKSIVLLEELVKKEKQFQEKKREKHFTFISSVVDFILDLSLLEQELDEQYFQTKTFKELKEKNHSLFEELLGENYHTSYANPAYCVKVFGKELGQLMHFLYSRVRNYIDFTFTHRLYRMEEWNKIFLEFSEALLDDDLDYNKLKQIITNYYLEDTTRDYHLRYKMQNDPDFLFYLDPVINDDLTDLRYLFKTGQYISENEIQMAEFMNNYPEDKIALLAKTISEAYQRGFIRDGKNLNKKSTVALYYRVGMEKLYRALIKEFQKIGLKPTVTRVDSKRPNRQYDYDTKFNNALYVSDDWAEKVVPSMEKGIAQNKQLLEQMSGVVAIINFGEERYSPLNKPENLRLTKEQTKIYQQVIAKASMIYQKYQNRSETSFCIISFPSPDIGKNFEKIFEKTIEINTIDTEKIENIQQKIIDVLDQAEKVIIKGKEKNRTDLTVKMQELNNPNKETNFVNSGSSVNIPAGEVFTSPRLKGTTGTLHVSKSYQNNVLFKNLALTFEDGYISDYSCSNFDSEQENKEYIEQNLLFPHKTLPMGEFAIGTNTLAYVYSRQYNILDVLPILISEKTAPHFAIGDTCFSHSEDVPRHNRLNNKLIVACDNEQSLLRKTEKKEEAYTNIHNDIVLPFDEIGKITAITANGKEIDIIKDGLFVLKGTEELNEPLLDYKQN